MVCPNYRTQQLHLQCELNSVTYTCATCVTPCALSTGGRGGSRSVPRAETSGPRGKIRSELRSKQQILKQRRSQEKQNFLQSGGMKKLKNKTKHRVQEMRKSAFGRGKSNGFKKGKMKKRS